MVVYHYTLFDLVKHKQIFEFEETSENSCKVKRSDFMEVPFFLKFLQGLFDKIMKKWFLEVWKEDMPMRERRFKVWKLGFKDFKGINFINNKDISSKDCVIQKSSEKYKLNLPISKVTNIKREGSFRLFKKSKHIGYGL